MQSDLIMGGMGAKAAFYLLAAFGLFLSASLLSTVFPGKTAAYGFASLEENAQDKNASEMNSSFNDTNVSASGEEAIETHSQTLESQANGEGFFTDTAKASPPSEPTNQTASYSLHFNKSVSFQWDDTNETVENVSQVFDAWPLGRTLVMTYFDVTNGSMIPFKAWMHFLEGGIINTTLERNFEAGHEYLFGITGTITYDCNSATNPACVSGCYAWREDVDARTIYYVQSNTGTMSAYFAYPHTDLHGYRYIMPSRNSSCLTDAFNTTVWNRYVQNCGYRMCRENNLQTHFYDGLTWWDGYQTFMNPGDPTLEFKCVYAVEHDCFSGCMVGNDRCNNAPECAVDATCGPDGCVSFFCSGTSGNEQWCWYRDNFCAYAGQSYAYCNYADTATRQQTCTYGCSGGQCNPPPSPDLQITNNDVWIEFIP